MNTPRILIYLTLGIPVSFKGGVEKKERRANAPLRHLIRGLLNIP
jgi:hypothetical protein